MRTENYVMEEEGLMASEVMWAIHGVHGLYIGTWLRKKDAIKSHCDDLGKSWKYCRSKGDRAIRVEISEFFDA